MKVRIVIIGGGFAGIEAALTAAGIMRSRAEVVLIDRGGVHAFIPSIHEIISGKIRSDRIEIPLDTICGPAGVRLLRDEALSIDARKRVVMTGGGAVPYDQLLIASGSRNSFSGAPTAEGIAYRFRTADDAERIRKDLERLIRNYGERRSVVLAGGGTEGVEVAGEVVDAIVREGADDELRDGVLSVLVIEGRPRLLQGFPEQAQEFAEWTLRERGVTIRTGTRIAAVRRGGVELDEGVTVPASMLIWTGGIEPSPLIRDLSLPKDTAGWLLVSKTLQSPGDDRVFGAGDIVIIRTGDGALPLQRLAYHAIDQGRLAAENIALHAQGRELKPYVPEERAQLISLGSGTGISVSGRDVRTGSWVVDLKKAVERKHLLALLTRAGGALLSRRFSRS